MTIDFSFPRLLQLIRRQWFENSRLYLFSVLALVGLTSLVFWVWAISGHDYYEEVTYFIFLIGLFISGLVFASLSFSALSEKTKATYWISSPASHLEKLLCVIFYSTIAFTIVYCLIFFPIRSIAVSYVQNLVKENPRVFSFHPVNWTNSFDMVMKAFIYGYFAVQAFYLLGSVYFSRYAFILTTVVGATIIILFAYYTVELSESFFETGYSWQGTKVLGAEQNGPYVRSYELPPFITGLLIFVFKFIWAPVFWVATWYRLKEKQV